MEYAKQYCILDDDDFDRRPTRRRYEEPTASKLRKMLLSIAESPMRLPEDEAKDIARLLAENFEDEEIRNEFFDVFVKLLVLLCFGLCD